MYGDSHIKQAISSIQLFVQRSLMNLEESVEAGIEVDNKNNLLRCLIIYYVISSFLRKV